MSLSTEQSEDGEAMIECLLVWRSFFQPQMNGAWPLIGFTSSLINAVSAAHLRFLIQLVFIPASE